MKRRQSERPKTPDFGDLLEQVLAEQDRCVTTYGKDTPLELHITRHYHDVLARGVSLGIHRMESGVDYWLQNGTLTELRSRLGWLQVRVTDEPMIGVSVRPVENVKPLVGVASVHFRETGEHRSVNVYETSTVRENLERLMTTFDGRVEYFAFYPQHEHSKALDLPRAIGARRHGSSHYLDGDYRFDPTATRRATDDVNIAFGKSKLEPEPAPHDFMTPYVVLFPTGIPKGATIKGVSLVSKDGQPHVKVEATVPERRVVPAELLERVKDRLDRTGADDLLHALEHEAESV